MRSSSFVEEEKYEFPEADNETKEISDRVDLESEELYQSEYKHRKQESPIRKVYEEDKSVE